MSAYLISGGVLLVLGGGALFRFRQLEKEEGTEVGLGLKLLAGLAVIVGGILLLSTGVSKALEGGGGDDDDSTAGGSTPRTYFLGTATVGAAGIVVWDTIEDTSNPNRLKGIIDMVGAGTPDGPNGRIDISDGYNYKFTFEITKVVPEAEAVLSICENATGCSASGVLGATDGVRAPFSITINKYDIESEGNKQVLLSMAGAFVSADATVLIEKLDKADVPPSTEGPGDPVETGEPVDPPDPVQFCANEAIGSMSSNSASLRGRLTDAQESDLGFMMFVETGLPVDDRPILDIPGFFDAPYLIAEMAWGLNAPCSAIGTTKGRKLLEEVAKRLGGEADDYLMFCTAFAEASGNIDVTSLIWARSVSKGASVPLNTNVNLGTSTITPGPYKGYYFANLFDSAVTPALCLKDR